MTRHQVFAALLLLATVFVQPRASRASASSTSEQVKEYELFRQKHGRAAQSSNSNDAVGFETRLQLYLARKAAVAAHNAQPGMTWTAGLNQFADYTAEEFNGMLGHRPSPAHRTRAPATSFLELAPDVSGVPDFRDWRAGIIQVKNVPLKNQGACGSCWAVAAVTALEFHAALGNNTLAPMSYEQLVDCVSNPHECGGQGGCRGATAELAYQYIQKSGLLLEEQYKGYQHGGQEGQCRPEKAHPVSLKSYTRLPTNELAPLLHALATVGPVVVSVDASGWGTYRSGVFNGCSKDATVNHAVVALGYGEVEESGRKLKYWLIRNSWGDQWGQDGHILLLRHDSDKSRPEDGYCGMDHNNQAGVGCKEDPKDVPVCGMCGVLSDSAYPQGVTVSM